MNNKHCSTCFNINNNIISAKFEVWDRKHRIYDYLCRQHMAAWFDIFANTNAFGLASFIIRNL